MSPVRPAPSLHRRTSGLLLHLTALPGRHGSGDLSAEAFRFVDFLAAAGQAWWQMLPVGPPGRPPGNSPYSATSASAGSPDLVSLDRLWQEGWLTRAEVEPDARLDAATVDFPRVRRYRERRLQQAWSRFRGAGGIRRSAFEAFCCQHQDWLDDFALYQALRDRWGERPWTAWPEVLRRREPAALAEAARTCREVVDYHRWVQFQFDRQWRALRRHARSRGVALMGDVPIFVAHDSADVWAHPELFRLDARGHPTHVSGYPPDEFCARGQRWGHPQYRWAAHERTGFRWWVARLAAAFRRFDAVRLDHFLGFRRLWSIPVTARSARAGHWVRTPGPALFSAVSGALGDLPMIAEDLGRVRPSDVRWREALGLPAMRVLQMGWGPGDPLHRPHQFTPQTVAYPGTHDTNTVVGWFHGLKPAARREVLAYAGSPGRHIHLDMIRLALNSVAHTVIVPVQDLLGLDARARMNRPGIATGNWRWRLKPGALTPALARQLRRMTQRADRVAGERNLRGSGPH